MKVNCIEVAAGKLTECVYDGKSARIPGWHTPASAKAYIDNKVARTRK